MTMPQKNRPTPAALSSKLGAAGVPSAAEISLSKHKSVDKQESNGAAPDVREQNPAKRPRAAPSLAGIPPDQIAQNLPSDEEMMHAFGLKTESAANSLLVAVIMGLGEKGEMFRSLVLAMGAEMEPTDVIEAMLVQQIGVTHSAMMKASCLAWDGKTFEAIEAFDRIRNRLARTFTTQIEALRRYRSGGEQGVQIGQVTVNQGGQAIVGNVGNGQAKNEK